MTDVRERTPVRGVLFDVGGVLTRNLWPAMRHTFSKLLAVSEQQLERADKKTFEDFQRGTISEERFWRKLCEEFRAPVPTWDHESPWEITMTHLLKAGPNPIMVGTARRLKGLNFKLGIISNMEMPSLTSFEELGVHTLFDARIYSCMEGCLKPEPVIFHRALRALALEPEETVLIDDRPENVSGAEAIGMTAHLHTSDEGTRDFLQKELAVTF